MSITQFLRILLMRRHIVIVALLASILAGVAIVKLIPKQYEAKTRVMLEIIRPDPVTGEILNASYARAYTKTQIELIKDQRVAGRAVDKLGWPGSAEMAAQYAASNSEQPFRRWLANILIAGTDARLIDASNILEISYRGQSPDAAARIANAVREAYEEQTIQFNRQDAQKNARWFEEQTAALRVQLLQAEARKTEFEKANDILLQDNDIDTDSAKLAALASSVTSAPLVSIPSAGVASGPGPAQMQLAQVDAAIANASRTLGPNHPDYIALLRQREISASAAAQERAAAAANARGGVSGSSGPSVGAMFDAQRERVLSKRGKLAEARQLQNDVAVLRAQLNETQIKGAKEVQEAQSADAGLTLLSTASPPDSPVFPNAMPILLGSIALGTGLGILLSLLIELLNRRVRSPDDLTFEGVPLVGVIQGRIASNQPRRLGRILRLTGPTPVAAE